MDCVGLYLVMRRHPVPFQMPSGVTCPLLRGSRDLREVCLPVGTAVGASAGASQEQAAACAPAAWLRSGQCPLPAWCQAPGRRWRTSRAPVTVPALLVCCFVIPVFVLSLMQVEFSMWRQERICVSVGICLLSKVLSMHLFFFFFSLVIDRTLLDLETKMNLCSLSSECS